MPRVRAVIYVRQSKEREESTSIEDQERLCRMLCDREGWEVVEVVIDRDTSGSEIPWRKRKHFPRVFDLDVDMMVVYRWSRLSRDDFDQREILKRWGALGRKVEAQAEPVDASTASGVLHRGILLEFAAHEAREKSERWKEALARRAERGLPKNGVPRFGYVRNEDKTFSPDPVTGPVLRELYLRYTAGAGFQGLCKWLNDEGVTTTRGREWGVHSLIRALDSGFGAGLLINGRTPHETYSPGVHEPVITGEEWEAYRRARKARAGLPPKRKNPRWYLSGLVRCGLCGAPMLVNSYTDAKSQAICSAYKNKRTCSGVWVNRVDVEHRVGMWLGGEIENLAAQMPSRDEERARAQSTVERLEADLAANEAAQGRLAGLLARELMTEAAYRVALGDLQGEGTTISKALDAARDEVARLGPVAADALAVLENVEEITPGEWGQAIGRVVREVRVTREAYEFRPVVGEPVRVAR